jgi:hypothetical protein
VKALLYRVSSYTSEDHAVLLVQYSLPLRSWRRDPSMHSAKTLLQEEPFSHLYLLVKQS